MIKINLIGQNYRREVARTRARLCFTAMLGVVVCASCGYVAFVERSLVQLRYESHAIQERSQYVQSMRKKIVALEAQRKGMQPHLDALWDAVGKRQRAMQLLKALAATIPDEAWLLEARVFEEQVELVGLSPSEATSAAFVHKLRETKLFSEVVVSKVTRREQTDVSMQEFQLKATFAPAALPGAVRAGVAVKTEEPA
jgi:Tfp pilus assembly protein PilN